MADDLKHFWQRFQSGLDVVVATSGHAPEKCFGARDAFLRYAHEILDRDTLPVTVQPCIVEIPNELSYTDGDTLAGARQRVEAARAAHPGATFVVSAEEGLGEIGTGQESSHIVKTWAVVQVAGLDPSGPLEAWGCSGGLQIPTSLFDHSSIAGTPTTRRGGGMVKSVTRGAESRRTHASTAIFLALCSLLFGRVAG